MSQTPKAPIPGKTFAEEEEARLNAPDEPMTDEGEGDPVDHDEGSIGVADDDTIGVNQDDDDERFANLPPLASSDGT